MTEFDPNQFESLKAALAGLQRPGPSVPRTLDQTILSDARRSFAARRRRWAILQRVSAGLAAAAVLTVAIRVFVPAFRSTGAAAPRPQLAQAADINRDGRVDILDAFIVARHISHGDSLDSAWDINGDGVVDQKDVDLVAHLAVRTDGGKPQ